MKPAPFFIAALFAALFAGCKHQQQSAAAPAQKPLTQQQIEQRWKQAEKPGGFERAYQEELKTLPTPDPNEPDHLAVSLGDAIQHHGSPKPIKPTKK